MLKILIVEDDAQLATTLKYLVEDNPRYQVVATADDLDGAVPLGRGHRPVEVVGGRHHLVARIVLDQILESRRQLRVVLDDQDLSLIHISEPTRPY